MKAKLDLDYRLYSIQYQLRLLYDLFSQPTGPLNLSTAGEEGLCWWFESLADQVGEVNKKLEGKKITP